MICQFLGDAAQATVLHRILRVPVTNWDTIILEVPFWVFGAALSSAAAYDHVHRAILNVEI